MPPRPRWALVTFDIDGTLTRGHGWKLIAERAGRAAAYRRANRSFFDGTVGEDAHLTDLLHLADGLTLPELEGVLERTPKVDGIAEMIRTWRTEGTRVALLSHNPEYVCAWYARRFGFDGYAGTAVPVPDSGPLELAGPVRADKLQGLATLLGRFDVTADRAVHVGDGRADVEVFRRVGAGVSLNSSLSEVEAAADLALRLEDVRGLPPQVDALPPRAARPPSARV